MKTLKNLLSFFAIISIVFYSCNKDEDTNINNDQNDSISNIVDIIPAGYENKIIFNNIYNNDTTDFLYGTYGLNESLMYLRLFFLHKSTQDTLSLYLGDFAQTNNVIANGTYIFNQDGDFCSGMAGDYSHGEIFVDSGQIILEKASSEYKIVLNLSGQGYGDQEPTNASLIGYFKGVLTEE